MIRLVIRGDREIIRMLSREQAQIKEKFKKFLNKWAFGTIRVVKEKYLTDPGRPRFGWRVVGSRKYPIIPPGFYPRPRIGVITGRLRASFGTPEESIRGGFPQSDGIRVEGERPGIFFMEIGTNVEYAPYVARRKYNFAQLGADEFYRSAEMEKILNELRRSIFAR